ncbi:hypothetical protein B0T11DRAFT_4293 [Plectosphaerella cucumerina]|uniref:Uncharacterized protein n=1 Tax=Plectosphaerella cucumerina TaxID=40658 RepID=A0A8K0TUH5_9PEZI|nr:hypothetical protein B0T11DRAFT_4293 [Plectosphaerella cucumerina]
MSSQRSTSASACSMALSPVPSCEPITREGSASCGVRGGRAWEGPSSGRGMSAREGGRSSDSHPEDVELSSPSPMVCTPGMGSPGRRGNSPSTGVKSGLGRDDAPESLMPASEYLSESSILISSPVQRLAREDPSGRSDMSKFGVLGLTRSVMESLSLDFWMAGNEECPQRIVRPA